MMAGVGARVLVASGTRVIGFEVAPKGSCWGILPRRLRWQFGDPAGEIGEGGLIRESTRQGDFDAGDHLGDTRGDFEQA